MFRKRNTTARRNTDILLERLEDRILFDATPEVTLDLPADGMINEDFSFSVEFDNTSATSGGPDDTGYGPFVDLHAHPGLNINSANYLGSDVTLIVAGEFNSNGDLVELGSIDPSTNPLGTLTDHPLLDTPVSGGTEGDVLYVLELPFGSFVPDQPNVQINLDATLDKDDGAAVGTPMTVKALGGFQYGTDADDNPGVDPPIVETLAQASTAQITPTLITLEKDSNAAEDETATGENFAVTYTLTVDIADGETVTDLDISDYLDNTLAYVDGTLNVDASGATAFTKGGTPDETPVTPGPQVSPDNDFNIHFDSVTGSAGSGDIVITYQAFVPKQDTTSSDIIDPASGDDEIGLNESQVTGKYDHDGDGGASTPDQDVAFGTDSPQGVFDNDGTDYRLNQKSIAIQKGVSIVTETGATGASPGDTLEYTLNFQISDYFDFDQLVLDDLFSDGQYFDFTFGPTFTVTDHTGNVAGTFDVRSVGDPDNGETFIVDETEIDLDDNASEDPSTDGTTRLTINLSDALIDAGRAGGIIYGGEGTGTGATGQIRFRTVIRDEYTDTFASGDRSVDLGDSITNTVSIDGRVRDAAEPNENNWLREADGSGAGVTIVGAALTKNIHAINGDTNFSLNELEVGDNITYRLTLNLPIADVENLVLTDFLPLPVFMVDDYNGDGTIDGNDANNYNWTLNTTTPPQGGVPAAGFVQYGDQHTLHNIVPSVTPTLDVDAAQNSLAFNFGTFDDPASQSAVIDVLFTVTANDSSFADELFLTNQANASYGTTGGESAESNALQQVTLRSPELTLTKGVVSSTAASPTYNPGTVGPVAFEQPNSANPAFTGQINSTNLAATPIDSDVTGGDAGDLYKFAIVIENTGGADAFDLIVNDQIPAGFRVPPTGQGLNLEIRDGDGNLKNWTGVNTGSDIDIFSGGVEITDPEKFYLAADGGDLLTRMDDRDDTDPATNETNVGNFGVPNIEAIARDPSTGVLYGANANSLGTIDTDTGAYTQIGSGFGTASGSAGSINLSDVDGLGFDPTTNELYGVHVRTSGTDILFKVDVATGGFVAGAFGGADYVEVNAAADVDDIAVDNTGQMYGTISNRLVQINKATGAVTDVGAFGSGVSDMEALDADRDGNLWGATGSNDGAESNRLYRIDKATGAVIDFRQLDNGSDYEGIAAFIPTYELEGTINDADDAAAGSDGSNILIITYDLELLPPVGANDGVVAGTTQTNNAELVSFGGVEGSGNDYTEEGTGDWIDTASVTVDQPTVSKDRTGTGVNTANNDNTEAVIGETISYAVTITVPEGTLTGAFIRDQLDSGLEFVQIDSVAASSGVTVNGLDATDPSNWNSIPGSGATGVMNFDFGTIDNTNTDNGTAETIVVNYTVRVQNTSSNESGDNLNNRARLRWDSDGNGSWDMQTSNNSAANTRVIEPELNVDQTLTLPAGSTGDAGDAVQYTIDIDHTAASETDAFDVTFSDPLPSEVGALTMADVTITHSTAGDISGLFEIVGGELRTVPGQSFDLLMGESVSIVINGTLVSSVEPGEQISNTASIKWTSLDDDEESGGTSPERDGEGAHDDYSDTSQTTTITIDDPSVAKSLISTSIDNSATTGTNVNNEAVIGETAVYEVVITFSEGVTNVAQLVDQMEEGLQFVSLDNVSRSSSALSTSVGAGDFSDLATFNPTTNGEDGLTNPQHLFFALGDVTNSNTDNGTSETLTLRYTVRVVNSSDVGTDGGGEDDQLTNLAQLTWDRSGAGGTDASNTSAAAAIQIIEPDLDITNSVVVNGSGTTGDSGDSVVYTIDIDHAAASTDAFDVTFSDAVSDRIDYTIAGVTATITHTDSSTTNITGVFEVLANGTLQTQSGQSFDLLEGETLQIVINGTLNDSVQPGEQINNTATIEWTSINDDEESGGTGVERDGESGAGTAPDDYVETSGNASLTISQPTISKSLVTTSITAADGSGANDASEVVIGELVTYSLQVVVREGTTNGALFIDTLDRGMVFDNIVSLQNDGNVASSRGDLTDTSNIGVATSGGDGFTGQQVITFDLGDLTNPADADSESIILTFQARVVNANTIGSEGGDTSTLDNSAIFRWDAASGGTDQTTADTAGPVTLIEPRLDMQSTITFAGGDASDAITFQTVISHDTDSVGLDSEADAFDLTFSDTIPDDVVYTIGNVTVNHDDGSTQTDITSLFEVVGGVLQTKAGDSFDLLMGETVTVTVNGTTATDVESGEAIANSASLKWTSIDDDEVSGSATSGERDGEQGAAGALDDYATTSSDSTNIATASIAKTLVSTSIDNSATTGTNDNSEAVIGETAQYQIVINVPEGELQSAELIDNLDLGLAFVSLDSVTASNNVTHGVVTVDTGANDGVTAAQTLTFDLGNVVNSNANAAGETITILYTVRVTNSSSVGIDGGGEATTLDNVAQLGWTVSDEGAKTSNASDAADISVIEPKLDVTVVADDDTPNLGQTVTYTVEISHEALSSADAHDINLTDLVPPGMTLQIGSIAAEDEGGAPVGFTNNSSGNNLDLTFDRLDDTAGAKIIVTYDAVVSSDPSALSTPDQDNDVDLTWTSLDGASTFERDGAGPAPDDYADGAVEEVNIVQPDVRVTISDGGLTSVSAGQQYTYTITVHNDGNDPATGVEVTDLLPIDRLTVDNLSGPGTIDYTAGTGALDWDIGTLGIGGSVQLQVTVTIDDPVAAGINDVQLSPTVTMDDIEPTPANNATSDTNTIVAAPDLFLTKDDSGATVLPDGVVVYTLTYGNDGTQDATGVVITETLPTGSTFDAANSTPGWTHAGGSTYTFTIGNLAADGSDNGTVDFAVQADSTLPAGQDELANSASIADDGTNGADEDSNDNTGTDNTPTTHAPDLYVSKDDVSDTVAPDGIVVYQISYGNDGSQGATGVFLTETVPAGSTFDSDNSTPGWVDLGGGMYRFDIGNLAADGSDNGTVNFAVQADSVLPAGQDELANTVTIADDAANGADEDNSDNTGQDTTTATHAPDLTVDIDDAGVTATAGGGVTYTLDYSNVGSQDTTGVKIQQTLPANATFDAANSTVGWSHLGGNLYEFTVGALASGGNGSIDFAIIVNDPLPAGYEQMLAPASIADDGANGADENNANNSDSETTPIDAAPDLRVTKDDGGVTAHPGDTVIYTINYFNDGDQDASNVLITETVPPGSVFLAGSSTPGWTFQGGTTYTINVGTVAGGGGSGSVTFVVEVNDPVAAAQEELSNTVSIGDDGVSGADSDTSNNSASDTTPIDALPDLALSKTDGGATHNAGEVVVYTLTYSNIGDQNAQNVRITETLPTNTTFDAAGSTAGWVDQGGGVYTFDIPLLVAQTNGAVDFAVKIADTLPAGVETVNNSAGIGDDGAGGVDPNGANNNATDDTPVIAAPDLSITNNDGLTTVNAGGDAVYSMDWANNGTQDATGVYIEQALPPGATFNNALSSAGWVHQGGGVYRLTLGNVNVGDSGTVAFAVTVDDPLAAGIDDLSNTATIADDTTNGPDEDNSDNSATDDNTTVVAAPDLFVTVDDSGVTAQVDDVVVYEVTYGNDGTQDATGVVLTQTVPTGSTFDAAASDPNWVHQGGGVYTLAVGDLDSGDQFTVDFAVRVDDPLAAGIHQLDDTASIADDGDNGADEDLTDNSDDEDTPIDAVPDLLVTTTDNGATATPGGTVVYQLDYNNIGDQDATGVVITQQLPAGTTFNAASSTPGWVDAGGGVYTFAVGDVNVSDPGSINFAVTVEDPIAAQREELQALTSIADDASNGAESNTANNDSQDDTPIDAAPDLLVTKSDGDIIAGVTDTVVYTLTYENNGTQNASGVVITENVPTYASFNAAASDPNWVNQGGGQYTFNVGNLNVGDSFTVDFAVDVDPTLPAGVEELQNTATIADDGLSGADLNAADDTGQDDTPVDAAPDLTITVDDGANVADTGDDVVYTVDYSNDGTQGATGVELTMTLPPGTTFNSALSNPNWVHQGGGVYTLDVGGLPANGNGSVEFAVTVDDPLAAGIHNLEITGTVADDAANGADLTPADNSSTDNDTLLDALPNYAVTKTHDVIGDVQPGQTFTYTIVATNNGDQDGTGVTVIDDLPIAILDPASVTTDDPANVNYDQNTGRLIWNIGDLGGRGGTRTLNITVTVQDPVSTTLDQLDNTADIDDDRANGDDPDWNDNTSTAGVGLFALPDYQLVKTDDITDSIFVGEQVVYTIVVTNNGNQDGTGVVVTDDIDLAIIEAASVTTDDPVNVSFDQNTGRLTWSVGNLDGRGDSATLNITAKVREFVEDPTEDKISNTAFVTDDGVNGPDSDWFNNESTVTSDLLVFAFDSLNDFGPNGGDDGGLFGIRQHNSDNTVSPPPVDPIFSGLATPGSTLKIRIFDEQHNVIGERQVVADTGGNWVANFPGNVIWKQPHYMTVEITPAIEDGDDASYNLRRYFQPSLNGSLFFKQVPSVPQVMNDAPYQVLDSIHQANHNPLGFGGDGEYESAVASNNTGGR